MRALALFFILALPAAADEVELTSGEVIRDCKVKEEGDSYRVIKGPGSRLIPKTDVRKVTYAETTDDQYLKKAKDLKDDDLDGHLKLAKWCADNKLADRAAEEYRKVVAINPDHEEARTALGFHRHLGSWLTEDEWKSAQGYVKHKGKWMTPEERDLDVALDQQKELEKKYVAEVKKWIDQLSSRDDARVAEAKTNLARLDDRYKVKPFVSVLRTSNASVRVFAAQELGRLKDEVKKQTESSRTSIVKALARMAIWDESLDARAAAIRALGSIDDPETYAAFLPFLGEEATGARIRTEDALGQFKSPKSVRGLLAALVNALNSLSFIEQYEKEIAQVIKDAIILKNGQKIMIPPNVVIAPNLFDKESRRLLAEERDTCVTALRAITGQDYGTNVEKWKAWLEAGRK